MSWKRCTTKPAKGGSGKGQRQGSGGCCPCTAWKISLAWIARAKGYAGRGCGTCFDDCGSGCHVFESDGTCADPLLTSAVDFVTSVGVFALCPDTFTRTLPLSDTGGSWVLAIDDASVQIWVCVKVCTISGSTPPTSCTQTPPALNVGCSSNFNFSGSCG